MDCLIYLLLDHDELLLLLHLAHGGGLLHLLDGHLHVWPGKGSLPSNLEPHQDDFPSSFGKASGWAPAGLPGLLLLDVGHPAGHPSC